MTVSEIRAIIMMNRKSHKYKNVHERVLFLYQGAAMIEFKSFYKDVQGNEGNKCHYSTRLDTYGCGCAHNCKYCYARSLLEFRGMWNPYNPSVGDVKEIQRTIRKIQPGTVIRLGGMTDCFQPAEQVYRLTYKTVKWLNRRGIHYLIVTKSALVADDEYMSIFDKDLAHIQVSVTATDDAKALEYENASKISDRIAAIEKLQKGGFDVALRLSPFIPQFIDFDKLNRVECDKILVEFLRCNAAIRQVFPIDYSEYTVKQSGYRHLPLKKKIQYIEKITGFEQMSVCEDESRAYWYWKTSLNHNPDDCCNLRK